MRRFLVRSLLLVPALVLACSTSSLTTTVLPITSLEVNPADFLGHGVTCTPGSMRLYVATLTDVSRFRIPGSHVDQGLLTSPSACYPAKECFVLPSSDPTQCFQTVSFQHIVAGRQYVVDIDGYDQDNLEALAPGSRILRDKTTKAVVAPRWKTSCGRRLAPNDLGDGGSAAIAEKVDGAAPAAQVDGAAPDAGDGAVSAVEPRPVPRLPEKPDSGSWYYECRAPEYPDGTPAWLGGPVCALTYETIGFHSCEPLAAAGN